MSFIAHSNSMSKAEGTALLTRMHSIRMRTVCCRGHLSCHACPPPSHACPTLQMSPATHAPSPCMPPAMHPHHTCLPCHAPLPHMPPLPCMPNPSPCTPLHHECPLCHHPLTHTPLCHAHPPFATHAPPPSGQTDTYENITFPQLLLVSRYRSMCHGCG